MTSEQRLIILGILFIVFGGVELMAVLLPPLASARLRWLWGRSRSATSIRLGSIGYLALGSAVIAGATVNGGLGVIFFMTGFLSFIAAILTARFLDRKP